MRAIILVLIYFFGVFSCKSEDSQSNDSSTLGIERFQKCYELFIQANKQLLKEREAIDKKNIFFDPIGAIDLFVETFKKQSPDLILNTNIYKNDLLVLLTTDSITKNKFFNENVVDLLYNLCINQYTDVIDSIYHFYKLKKVDFQVLQESVHQNFNLSNQVARNFQYPKLRGILTIIMKDKIIATTSDGKELIDEIQNILSGDEWNEIKELEETQPPFLKSVCE